MSDAENPDDIDFGRYLPVPVATRAPRPSLIRVSTEASFLSQLIVTHERPTRSAPAGHAVSAYGASASSAVRRMPNGYNRTVVA
jgi:hypothetical protein